MENIIEQNSVEQYKKDSVRYGIEVNRRRAIPDARDGLKLVHRRILDVMANNEPCMTQLVKTAAVIGSTMKKSHPHGDSSIGDAIKPLANWFESMMPLIYTESNMGNMQGDGAAAPRYTEIKLSKFAIDCVIGDMKESKSVVDWSETFDNRSMEPDYFPVAVPLLLVNGTYGIGYGIKVEIPKHNLVDVIDETIKLIKNPNHQVVLIPDQCMPCEIIEANWKSISNKGRGSFKVRGIINIEQHGDRYNLVIKSFPDRVFFDKGNPENGGVKYKILDMVKDGKLPQITQIDEDSHGTDMKIIIHLRKGSDPNFVRETLYKNTQLEETFHVNFEVLNGIELVRMSYTSYIQFFIEESKIRKFRLYCNKLQQIKTKYHERETYVKLLESGEIDNVINMIKNQTTIDDTYIIEYLIKKIHITDIQAKFIINSDLKALSKAYLNKYKKEVAELKELDKYYMDRITKDELILQDILDELEGFKAKYKTSRHSKIIKLADVDNIPSGSFKLVFTENGYVKKLNPQEYVGSYRGDNPTHVIKVENTENVLLFTDQGKVFKLPVHKVQACDKNSIGTDIRILIKGLTSNIIQVMYEPTVKELAKKVNKYFLVMVTSNNYIKKLDLEDISNAPASGIIYTKLTEADVVKDIKIINNKLDVVIYSGKKALRVPMSEISHYKRASVGVTAMKLTDDTIDGIEPLYPDVTDIVIVTRNGKFNKFSTAALPSSKRGRAGSSVIKLMKGDEIISIFGVNDKSVIKVTTQSGKIDILVGDIKQSSSISSGDKLIPTRGDMILKCELFKK